MKGLQNYQHNFCLARNLQRFWSQQLVLLWEGEGFKRPSRHFRAQTFVYINRKLILGPCSLPGWEKLLLETRN